jgi:hypothetical protein
MSGEFLIGDRTPKKLDDLRHRFIKVHLLGLIEALGLSDEDELEDRIVRDSGNFVVLAFHGSSFRLLAINERGPRIQFNTPIG